MKESYKKGLASHLDSESCVYNCKVIDEALTGAHAGQPSSGEINSTRMPMLLSEAEGNMDKSAICELISDSAPSETLCMHGNSSRGNREILQTPCSDVEQGRLEKTTSRNPSLKIRRKSDDCIVPKITPNNDICKVSAEAVEGRQSPEGNAVQRTTVRTQSRGAVSNSLERVRKAAKADRKARFTSLLHHVSPETLLESFYALKRNASPGLDGKTWFEYQKNLTENLKGLHSKLHSGTYRAQPSKRIFIAKADGRQRPIGISALEDKIAQMAVGRVISAVFEQDFVGFSYGFRPGKSQHDALDAVWIGLKQKKVNWVLDADIQGFFDTINHEWMLKFVEHRVADPRILRLIRKWLKAGVSEDGRWINGQVGTPQGAVISPLLANIYLHYVFDQWINAFRSKCLSGDVVVIRYADDTVLGFQHKYEAEKCLAALRERLGKFGLLLHPEKTRLIEFGRFAISNRRKRGERKPETFDFLGFTHICAITRIKKQFHVKRITSNKRMRSSLAKVKIELRSRIHENPNETGKWIRRVILGYYQYHAIPGNWAALSTFCREIVRTWLKNLRRRGQKRRINWRKFSKLVKKHVPDPKLCHPHPNDRFYAKHPKEEPSAVVPHAGICAGGAG